MSQAGVYNTGGVVPPGTAVVTITGNTGAAVPPDGSGNIDIVTQNTTVDVAGIPVSNLLTINFGISNLILGTDASGITTATENVGYGLNALNAITSGQQNAGFGVNALTNNTTGSALVFVGYNAGAGNTTASNNTGVGYEALRDNQTGTRCTALGTGALRLNSNQSDNTALGSGALQNLAGAASQANTAVGSFALTSMTSGNNNIAVGVSALGANFTGSRNIQLTSSLICPFTGTESNNILIGNAGTLGVSNRLAIGSGTGTGSNQLSTAFIYGIDGVNVGSVAKVVTMASDQLGTATITAGTGITVTPGANSITISATTTGMPWTVVTGASQALAVNNGYIANNAGTINFSLPASSAVGNTIRITGINNATGWKITQGAGQQIFFGTSSTTAGAGGSITSSATRDSIEIVCVVANTTWNVLSCIGNPTIV